MEVGWALPNLPKIVFGQNLLEFACANEMVENVP